MSERKKAPKKNPKKPKKPNYGANGKTVGGYTPAKLEIRAKKRAAK